MKILICTGIFPPDIGGPATYSQLLQKKFSERENKVGVVTYGPSGISRSVPKGLRHLVYFLVCFFRAFAHDILFAQDPVSAGLPAMLAAKLSGRKFVVRVAGDYAWEQAAQRFGVKDGIDDFQNKKYGFGTELLRLIQKFTVRRADAVISPSVYFRNLVARWLKNPRKAHAIYNGIELEKMPAKDVQEALNEKLIVSAGRLVPWKGFSVLIEMMKELPDWKLEIAGEGPEKENLEAKIKELGLANVSLAGGLPRNELTQKISQAALFVLNTSFESFSFQVVEAMNAGTPVISTNIGNLSEIIESGQEGILVKPDDKEAILAAVQKLSDPAFYAEISNRAREKAQKFSLENMLANLETLLKSL